MKREEKNIDMIESSEAGDQKNKLDNEIDDECRPNVNDARLQPREMLYHDLMNRQRDDPGENNRILYRNSQTYYQDDNGQDIDSRESYFRGGYTREMLDKNGHHPRFDQNIHLDSPEKGHDNYYQGYAQQYQQYDSFNNSKKKMDLNSAYSTKRKPKVRICSNCQTRNTPSWRRSGDGKKLLCNACGLYQKLHGRPRPFAINSEGKTKAIKTNIDRVMCMNCRATETTYWRRSNEGHVLCNSCSLYLRDYVKLQPDERRVSYENEHKYEQDFNNNYYMQHHPNPSMRYIKDKIPSQYSRDSLDFERNRKQTYQKRYFDDYTYNSESTRNRLIDHSDEFYAKKPQKNKDSESNECNKVVQKKRSKDDDNEF